MNLAKLRDAEALFMQKYPGGFEHEEMQRIGKKHNVPKLVEFAQNVLAKKNFAQQGQVLDNIVKTITRSSMVSMFEKPKFRDYVNGLNREDRAFLAQGFKRLLHGKQEQGFNDVIDVLVEGKLAKWSLISAIPMYYRPQRDVFVKPTTTKNVIRQFELDHLVYRPLPSWEFYRDYRAAIEEMKAAVDPSLSPSNAAFTGFLMMSTAVDE